MKGGVVMNRKVATWVQVGATLAMLAMPMVALALTNPTVPAGISGRPVTLSEIEDIIRLIAQFLILISVVIAVIVIIWGGITWMTAGGSDEQAKKGKGIILQGIFGAAVILGVGVILQTLAGIVTRQFLQYLCRIKNPPPWAEGF